MRGVSVMLVAASSLLSCSADDETIASKPNPYVLPTGTARGASIGTAWTTMLPGLSLGRFAVDARDESLLCVFEPPGHSIVRLDARGKLRSKARATPDLVLEASLEPCMAMASHGDRVVVAGWSYRPREVDGVDYAGGSVLVAYDREGNRVAAKSFVLPDAPARGVRWSMVEVLSADPTGDLWVGGRRNHDPSAEGGDPGAGFVSRVSPDLERRWTVFLDAAITSITPVSGGDVLVVDEQQVLRRLRGSDGATLWSKTLAVSVRSIVANAAGATIFGEFNRALELFGSTAPMHCVLNCRKVFTATLDDSGAFTSQHVLARTNGWQTFAGPMVSLAPAATVLFGEVRPGCHCDEPPAFIDFGVGEHHESGSFMAVVAADGAVRSSKIVPGASIAGAARVSDGVVLGGMFAADGAEVTYVSKLRL